MFVDCLSSCTGFAVAFGLLEDAQTLALWRTGERKGCQKQKNRPKFLDTDALIYSTLTTDTDKFSAADIRYCSTADKIPKLVIIGVTRNRIYRWEISRSFSSNRWECTDLIDFDVTDFTIQKISLCGTGGILASFDGASGTSGFFEKKYSVSVRDEQLNTVRVFSSSQYTAESATALLFHSEDLLLTAYEKGRILGWSVLCDALIFDCDILLNKTNICCLGVATCDFRHTSLPERGKSLPLGEVRFFASLIAGCRDGKLRVLEVDNFTDAAVICRETGILDLKKGTRYLQYIAESALKGDRDRDLGEPVASTSDFGVPRGGGRTGPVRPSRGEVGPSIKRESSFVPIAIGNISALSDRMRVAGLGAGQVNEVAVKSVCGSFVAATSDALIFFSLSPFQMQKYMPLSLLGVNTISEASICVSLADGGAREGGGGGGVAAGAVMITAFERKAATFTSPTDSPDSAQSSLPLLKNERTERTIGHSEASQAVALHTANLCSADSAPDSTYEGEGEDAVCGVGADPTPVPPRKRTGWSFAPPYPLPQNGRMRDSEEEGDDNESGSQTIRASSSEEHPHYIEHAPRERQEGESLYSDPAVPLSLFLLEGVLPPAPQDGDPAVRRILPPPTVQKDADKIKSDAKEKEKEKEKMMLGKVKGSWEAPSKDKSGKLVDLPVIFQPQLRSSGYGQGEGQGAVKKPILVKRQSSSAGRLSDRSTCTTSSTSSSSGSGSKSQTSGGSSGSKIRIYPSTCDPMSLHQAYNDYPVLSGPGTSSCLPPISSISYSADASQLALATGDTALSTVKLPVSRNSGDGSCFLAHNGRVTDVCFSHDKKMLLSASADGTAMVWTSTCQDSPSVVISHTKRQCSSASSTSSSSSSSGSAQGPSFAPRTKVSSYSSYAAAIAAVDSNISKADTRNRPLGAEINAARFFYMDKFIMLTVKASVNLYTFRSERADPSGRGDGARAKGGHKHSFKPMGTLTSIADLNKKQSAGVYECVCEWQLSPAQSVTALACVNSVQSPIALCATSDRKLHVLDAAVGCVARTLDCYHERYVHCIALPTPSVHAQVQLEAYNLFATAATDNVVSLWDLRAPSVVFRYSGHVNRRELITIALSPCLRYLATGSEDRSARIVDVRGGKEIVKIQGHRDVVSGVAFNPLFPQLATCSFDGTVKFYVDPTASDKPMPGL